MKTENWFGWDDKLPKVKSQKTPIEFMLQDIMIPKVWPAKDRHINIMFSVMHWS